MKPIDRDIYSHFLKFCFKVAGFCVFIFSVDEPFQYKDSLSRN